MIGLLRTTKERKESENAYSNSVEIYNLSDEAINVLDEVIERTKPFSSVRDVSSLTRNFDISEQNLSPMKIAVILCFTVWMVSATDGTGVSSKLLIRFSLWQDLEIQSPQVKISPPLHPSRKARFNT